MKEQLIGRISHYYTRICVAGIVLIDTLQAGDIIRIRGKTTDFVQRATSMQFNHQPLLKAVAGQEIGLFVDCRVRPGDKVYRLHGPEAKDLLAKGDQDLKQLEVDR